MPHEGAVRRFLLAAPTRKRRRGRQGSEMITEQECRSGILPELHFTPKQEPGAVFPMKAGAGSEGISP